MAYHEDVVAVAVVIEKLLKILQGGFGSKTVGLQDLCCTRSRQQREMLSEGFA